MARRAGFVPYVGDVFGDEDTRELAAQWHAIGEPDAMQLDAERTCAVAERVVRAQPDIRIVTGTGFEDQPELVTALAKLAPVLGNTAKTIAPLKDPVGWCNMLRDIGIATPDTQLEAPANATGWLAKQAGSAGGFHVRAAEGVAAAPGTYFQRHVAGQPMSATFLADGKSCMLLGINDLMIGVGAARWAYAGAVTQAVLHISHQQRLLQRLIDVVGMTGLRGLGSVDFIFTGTQCIWLEINPRPTATAELHDPDWVRGLITAHIAAFGSAAPMSGPPAKAARAHQTFFAPYDIEIPEDFPWPSWTTDLSMPGRVVATGSPLCTVHASGRNTAEARSQLRRRHNAMLDSVMERAA
jgi:uncharacterized protein